MLAAWLFSLCWRMSHITPFVKCVFSGTRQICLLKTLSGCSAPTNSQNPTDKVGEENEAQIGYLCKSKFFQQQTFWIEAHFIVRFIVDYTRYFPNITEMRNSNQSHCIFLKSHYKKFSFRQIKHFLQETFC